MVWTHENISNYYQRPPKEGLVALESNNNPDENVTHLPVLIMLHILIAINMAVLNKT